jgi:organic radical activating enzyme
MSPEKVLQTITEAAAASESYGVCLTGGEPFLQPSGEMDELINLILFEAPHLVRNIEAFSNGTRPYSSLVTDNVVITMDWKLKGSGELSQNWQRDKNFQNLDWGSSVKFTIKDHDDYVQAKQIYNQLKAINQKVNWYYGVVWEELDNDELIGWVLEDGLPWRFTMQVHNYVWNREKRGI